MNICYLEGHEKKVLHLPSCKYLQTAEIFTLLAIYPQRPTYTARLFLKIVRAMCQEMYKKKYNDHIKTKYMQKYNYLITHFHANRRLVLIVPIAAITDTGSKR